MFWRFGGYANISTIDTLLDKPEVTLEEVLDESDLIQELKQHNSKLIEYLREESVLQRLLAYVIAPPLIDLDEQQQQDEEDEESEEQPPQSKTFSPIRSLSSARGREPKSKEKEEREEREESEKTRQKYAYVAAEILSSETWSIVEALMENQEFLRQFWEYIRKEPPLDPATAGYFTKINETLLDKKTEETLSFIKSLPNIVPAILQHVDCPMVLDLLLKIISMEKAEGGQGIVDWLESQDLMPSLLAFLGENQPTFTQTSAGDFIKAIITISANASQNEQSCIGPNSLTRQLVSEPCIESLITNMLKGGNPLTVGVGIIIEVIRKNNSDYDPEIRTGQEFPPTTSDPIYLGTLLRLFAKHVPDFMDLILSPNHTVLQGDTSVSVKRKSLSIASGVSIEPLGFDRFKTCELMAELLHCSNMGLLNEKGSEAFIQQRDVERERLRVQGFLGRPQEPQSAVTEFSEGASSFNAAGETPPGSGRRLEVTNSAEDDGFEDVRASDIDEMKEAADEDEPSDPKPIKQSKSRLSLEDEFFDEPLDNPPEPIKSLSAKQEPELDVAGSPSTAVAKEVDRLQIEGEGSPTEIATAEASNVSTADDLVSAIDAQLAPASKTENLEPPSETAAPAAAGSPNPDDTPAPLFTKPRDPPPVSRQQQEHGEEQRQSEEGLLHGPEQDIAVEPFVMELEDDVDGRPIVGDHLKMQFVEFQVVPTILEFFFRFPWNNFLHNVVYDVVQQVFNGPMDRGFNRNLAFDLFDSGRITERIIEGQQRSDAEQARSHTRLGYMGHLTLVAEEVVKFSERNPPELLSEEVIAKVTAPQWSEYVEVTLNETRERDNAILGGVRPDMAVGPRQAVLNAVNAAQGFGGGGGSAALANAGLNGGSGLDSMDLTSGGVGAGAHQGFLSQGGSLLSGFGSSSDEEDEDMDDATAGGGGAGPGEEEIGSGSGGEGNDNGNDSRPSALSVFSANPAVPETDNGADPSSASSIPPPLSVPPSRARRQLAARLAMHSKNAAQSGEGGRNEGESLSPGGLLSPGGSLSPGAASPGSLNPGGVLSPGAVLSPGGSLSPGAVSAGAVHSRSSPLSPSHSAQEPSESTEQHTSQDQASVSSSEPGQPTPTTSESDSGKGVADPLDALLSAASHGHPSLAADAALKMADSQSGGESDSKEAHSQKGLAAAGGAATQNSETAPPFSRPSLQPGWQPRAANAGGEWVNFETSSGSSDDDDEGEEWTHENKEGEDIPIGLSNSPRTMGRGIAQRVESLFGGSRGDKGDKARKEESGSQ